MATETHSRQRSTGERSTTSISSADSVDSFESVMDFGFVQQITDILDNETSYPTSQIYKAAHLSIDTLEVLDRSAYTYYGLDLQLFLRYLLLFSQNLGDRSMRYTSSAILACNFRQEHCSPEDSQQLIKLAVAWLAHLIYPMKANGSIKSVILESPESMTPTRHLTSTELVDGVGESRDGSFKSMVLARDGYKCAVTGVWDIHHRPPNATGPVDYTQGAHVLKRAVAQFKSRSNNQAERNRYYNAISTWDIIRNYGSLTDHDVQNLDSIIDHPCNGLTLMLSAHQAWDDFKLGLKATDRPNVYKPEVFGSEFSWQAQLLDEVTFQDRSGAGHDLPTPRFIALHHAICGVLHMSGAGALLDSYIDRYNGSAGAVPSGPQLRDGIDFLIMMSVIEAVSA